MFKFIRNFIVGALVLNALSSYLNGYNDRNRTAEGLFGGALSGAVIGGLAGGGRGAGIGAAVGAGVGLMAGSAADQRANSYYYDEPISGPIYEYRTQRGDGVFVGRNRVYYTFDEQGNQLFFYTTRSGRRMYLDSDNVGY